MKRFSQLLLAVALTVSGLTGAYAADPTRPSTYLQMDTGAPGVFTDTWTISTTTAVAGTTFDDAYSFNVLDTPNVSFALTSLLSSVDFSGDVGGYALYYYADYTYGIGGPLYSSLVTSTDSMAAGSFLLSTGSYVLEVGGTYTMSGAGYGGTITGTVSAVPEPSAVLMLLLGLMTVAGAMRFRQRQQ